MATHDREMSHLLFFWLLFVLGDLLKNASCFVGRLTLLKKSDQLERVHGHHLVHIRKLKLLHLGLRKEDRVTLLLRHGYLHHLTEVVTIKIADELYLMPHELVQWHEGRLLGSTKPADQLVTDMGEPSDCIKIIPDAFVEVCLCMVCIGGASLGNTLVHLVRTMF